MALIALDTETTGVDAWHGAKPFLVTIALTEEVVLSWEWEVDPQTRQPNVLKADKLEIEKAIKGNQIVMQNPKFDVRMLENIGIEIDWSKVYDTLIASHLINSAIAHDLTSSALRYLAVDIKPFEDAIKECTQQARRVADKEYGWRIAKKGHPDMPSAKDKVWKYDLWVPRQLAEKQNLPEDHPWHHVVHDYAFADPVVTLALFKRFRELIDERGLWKIYEERLKQLPIVYEMEDVGITYSEDRMVELTGIYEDESERANNVCTNIAKSMGFELQLPKSGNNLSLLEFAFDVLKLPVLSKSKKTGNASLDKNVLADYTVSLPPRSKQLRFAKNLAAKRKRDTALIYMQGYDRFSLPIAEGWRRLHPAINLTGTKTLRSSSKNPNEQNISKQEGFNLRYAFGPAPGREWWALDYDNLELRIPAYECEEPAMLDLFERPTEPPFFGSYHLLVFSILYPDEFSQYGSDVKTRFKSTLYQWTKNGNFAELYGAVDTGDGNSTADRAFHYPGAQAIVSNRLKKKTALNEYWIDFAHKHGYVTTMPDKSVDPDHGYPIHCPISSWGNISPTVPLNYHVQGTACWIKQRAMIKADAYLKKVNERSKEKYHMVMDVHDEIVFDFPYKPNKGNLPKVNKIRRLMESCGPDVGIPLTCGVDYHPNNWSEAA